MKRLFTLSIVFIFTLHSVVAQSLGGGIKAGVNVANFTGSSFEDATKKALIGYHAGGFLNIKMGTFSLQPELLVSTSGAKIERSGLSENFKLTYVTIPVMLQINTPGGFFIEGGPQLGFKISEDIPEQTIETFGKGLDLAAGLGIGFRSKPGFGFGVRYLVGLSKVGDFDPTASIDPDFKHSTLQAGLFLMLGGNKKN